MVISAVLGGRFCIQWLRLPPKIDITRFFIRIDLVFGYSGYLATILTRKVSFCSLNYVNESRKATIEEYTPLKTELESIGYNLKII